jgi:uncharacterized membrane protein
MAKKRTTGTKAAQGKSGAEAVPKATPKSQPKSASHPAAKTPRARRKLPNWPVLILALAGMALSGFLTGTAWLGQELPYCTAGSSCDIVQSSRWGYLLGLPISAWGFGAFAVLAFVAARVRGAELHWKLSWTVALLAAAISLYLTAIALFALQAACVYCLASTGIALTLFGVVAWQAPGGLPEFTWPGWLAQTGGLAAVVVIALHLHYSGAFSPAMGDEDPYLRALAEHLSASEARFYGAFWCPHCEEQKELFGPSAARLPYIECSPGGRNAPPAAICSANGVSTFPTWVIDGRRYVGKLSPDELARHSRFVPPLEGAAAERDAR